MPTTISDVIDRVLRDFLVAPDMAPSSTILQTTIDDSNPVTIEYDGTLLPPEENELLGGGSLLEIDSEQILVSEVDEESNTFTTSARGLNGTVASDHTAGTEIRINPLWPRRTIFDAVSDAIVGLYPDLYGTDDDEFTLSASTYTELPIEAVGVLSCWVRRTGSTASFEEAPFSFLYPFPPSSTKRAISTPIFYGTEAYVTYQTKFTRPTELDESELLSDLGISDESWVQLIVVSAVSYLINTRDIDDITEEFIDAQLRAQQPGQASSIRDRLIGYESFLRDRAKRAQRFEHPQRMLIMGV